MCKPVLRVTPLKPAIPHKLDVDLFVAVSISVPPRDPATQAKRSLLNFSLAIDKSGSMTGAPLAEAKACASRVVAALYDDDRISIISYDDRSDVDIAALRIGADRQEVLRAISRIQVRGMTDVHGGWIAAAEQAATGVASNILTRVVILSDGNSNKGLQDVAEICTQVEALAAKGVATSTVGLGSDFNEHLMTSIARSGGGQASYGETAADLWPSFEAEFGLLSATCGKNVRLTITSPLDEVIAGSAFVEDGANTWIMPDLAYGGGTNIILRLKADGRENTGKVVNLVDISLQYTGMDGTPAARVTADCQLPVVSNASFAEIVEDPKVARLVQENRAAEIQAEASIAARDGDTQRVRTLAAELTAIADDNVLLAAMALRLTQLADRNDMIMAGKESAYGSNALRRGYKSSGEGSAAVPEFAKTRTRQGKVD